jgi:hypothetical protein
MCNHKFSFRERSLRDVSVNTEVASIRVNILMGLWKPYIEIWHHSFSDLHKGFQRTPNILITPFRTQLGLDYSANGFKLFYRLIDIIKQQPCLMAII